METPNQETVAEKKTLGEIQERFKALWEKSKQGLTTPEENNWLLTIQEEYWENPQSLGNLYH